MKPVDIESSIGFDRLATGNEVRCALSLSSQGAFEFVGDYDDFREIDSDPSGRACNVPEDILWLAIIREMPDSKSN